MAFIENEAAYDRAIQANIRANWAKTNRAKWDADPQNEAVTEFIRKGCSKNSFLKAMWDNLADWGGLTAGQRAAVVRMMEKDAARKAEFAKQDAASNHVGQVGERLALKVKVKFAVYYDTDYGTVHIYGFTDDAGNVFIYKGKWLDVEKSEVVYTIKGTVKAHEERNGVKQTVIQRVKVIK